jgi:hypothetical protein
VGGSPHNLYVFTSLTNVNSFRFRTPKSHEGQEAASGFLDGDFLEQFLTRLSEPVADSILDNPGAANSLGMSLARIQEVLESLRSLH